MSFIVNGMPKQIHPDLVAKCERAETATIGHKRILGFARPEISWIAGSRRIAGTAVTLAIPAQDSTILHHAVQFLRSDDVLVIDRLGDSMHACLGGGVACAIKESGCSGVILDGPCTDLGEIREFNLPVWCSGVSPITTRLHGTAGAMNVPVCCGGAAVLPGYGVIADECGALFIPPQDLESDVDWALGYQSREPALHAKLRSGAKLGELSGASKLVEIKS
ncbi:MAG: RraA family protein [Albidovulum sp.]|nr:RraA family protein [Albidovulum sp.]